MLQTLLSSGCSSAPGNACSLCPTHNMSPHQIRNVSGLPPGREPRALLSDRSSGYTYSSKSINRTKLLCELTWTHYVPVICNITHDGSEQKWTEMRRRLVTNFECLGAFLGDPVLLGLLTGPSNSGLDMSTGTWTRTATGQHPPRTLEICGFAGVAWSPISLLWEEDASLERRHDSRSFLNRH